MMPTVDDFTQWRYCHYFTKEERNPLLLCEGTGLTAAILIQVFLPSNCSNFHYPVEKVGEKTEPVNVSSALQGSSFPSQK